MGSRSNRRNMPGDKYYNFEKPNPVNYSKFSPPPNFQNYEEHSSYSGRPQDYNDLPISQNYERIGFKPEIPDDSQYQPYREQSGSERRRSRSSQRNLRANSHRRSPHQNRGRNKSSRNEERRSPRLEFRKRSPAYKDHYYDAPNRNHFDKGQNNQEISEQHGRNYNSPPNMPGEINEGGHLDDYSNNGGYLPMSNIPSLINFRGNAPLANELYSSTHHPEETLTVENPFSGMAYQPSSQSRNETNESPIIPEFNPETSKLTSEEWMDLIEDVAVKQNWTRDEKQYMMTSRLTGLASKWYLTSGVGTKTWDSLKSTFLGAFPTELEYFELLKRMMARVKTKDESISNYFHHKMALLNACEIFGRKAVSCLIYGIPTARIKREAKRLNFNDPDSLYTYLRTCDFTTGPYDKGEKPHEKEEKAARFQNSTRNTRRKDEPQEEIPSLFKQQSAECFTEAHVKDIRFRAYIDETSDTTTIREEDCIDTKLPIKRQSQTIKGHGGSLISSVGYVETSLVVDKAKANVKLYVVPTNTQPFPIVVGSSFLEQRHIYILNKEKRMRIYQKMDDGFINFDF